MIWPQMYLDGIAKQNETNPEKWVGESKKMETLFSMIDEHPTEKTLIFSQFKGEMNHIQSQLQNKYQVFRIDGSVPKEERNKQIQAFKKTESGAIFIIQIKTGGQGLNLQEATRVYITGPSWNPAAPDVPSFASAAFVAVPAVLGVAERAEVASRRCRPHPAPALSA